MPTAKQVFGKCKTPDEACRALRAELERARGRKFKVWKCDAYISGANLRLNVREASTTPSQDRWFSLRWANIVAGECWDAAHAPLRKYRGIFGVLVTSTNYVAIDLSLVPHIKKIHEARVEWGERKAECVAAAVHDLERERDALNTRIAQERTLAAVAYKMAHPIPGGEKW